VKKTMSMFPSTTEWTPPNTFPDLSSADEIAIDLETCDPNMEKFGPGWPRKDGYIVGYAIAVDGWKGYYPVAHQGGGNIDKKIVERWVQKVLDLPATKIMHNAAYDLGWLKASGFNVNGKIIDTMIAAGLVDENRFSYALNSLGFDYLKDVKSEQGLKEAAADFGVHPKKELWKLPAMFVGDYAEQDAALTLKLWQYLKTQLAKEEVESIFELETELLPILVDLTYRGVRFDRNKAEELMVDMRKRETEALKGIKRQAGVGVDIWAAQSIAIAFDKLGIVYPKTATGMPSFTKSFLDSHDHPISSLIVQARELNKTHGTFLQPYLDFSEATGRIHTHFNQLRGEAGGTVTGRMSASSPNLQQCPARHPLIGPAIRGLFLPDEGQLWASNDFSSQEPRLLIHYASLLNLPGTERVVSAYNEDPRTDFYQIVADAAGVQRKVAKTCIAEGELVLTDRGLVPIESVEIDDRVWDGVEWVQHDGVVFMGIKEVITYGNLTATPDHDVWTIESGKIPFGVAASRLDALVSTGNSEQAIPFVDGDKQGDTASWKASVREGALQMWRRGLEAVGQLKEWEVQDVSTMHHASAACGAGELCVVQPLRGTLAGTSGRNNPALQQSQKRRMEKLRRTWDSLRIQFRKGNRGIPDPAASSRRMDGLHHRPNQQQWELRGGEYPKSNLSREQHEPTKFKAVYDILNAGPRHRFTVSDVLVSNCSLGMMYGMGKNKLAAQLDMPLEEASELIGTFHEKVPFLRGTVDAVMRRIEHPGADGAIRTLLGRKCRFPLWEPIQWGINKALPYDEAVMKYGPRVKRAMTYKGLNRLIQGSAADQTKAAMVALHKAGFKMLLQIHDEIALSVDTREEAEEAARIMANATPLVVPSVVDVEMGDSWGHSML